MTSITRVMLALGCLGFIAAGVGCQTWVGGMTLPSPDYLKDKPDYIAPAPQYKHSHELSSMQRAMAETNPDAGYAPRVVVPAPVAPAPRQAVPVVPVPSTPPPAQVPPAPAAQPPGGAPPMGPGGN
jgi:hypothetical protein